MKFSGNVRNAMRNNWLDFGSNQWAVCLSVSIFPENLWMDFNEIFRKDWGCTRNKPLNFGSDSWPVCLSVSILLKNLWLDSMKFSGKIEDGTSNEPLDFGNDSWSWRRFVLSECTLREKICALWVFLVFFSFFLFKYETYSYYRILSLVVSAANWVDFAHNSNVKYRLTHKL